MKRVVVIQFTGPRFEKLLGQDRHRWMKSLGNKFIESRSGPNVQIADPSAADTLLDLALESVRHAQRLLFFCSCRRPRCDGEIACHRATVAELVLNAARNRGVTVEIVEWTGGKPRNVNMEVTPQVFAAVGKGRMTLPLGEQPDLVDFAGLPWCSIANLHSHEETLHRIVGPAIRQPDQWVLPVLHLSDPASGLAEYEKEARKLRKDWGLEPASV